MCSKKENRMMASTSVDAGGGAGAGYLLESGETSFVEGNLELRQIIRQRQAYVSCFIHGATLLGICIYLYPILCGKRPSPRKNFASSHTK